MTKLQKFHESYMKTSLSTLLSVSSVNPEISKGEFTLKIPVTQENDFDFGTIIAIKLLQAIEIICPSLFAPNNTGYQIKIGK